MMKKLVVTLCIIAFAATTNVSAQRGQAIVKKWGIFTIEMSGPSTGNPFTDVELSAIFKNKNKEICVSGFYDGEKTYLIHFSPDEEGIWTYKTKSNVSALSGKTGKLKCTSPEQGNHGPVKIANTYYLDYADGTPYFSVGTTCYAWIHQPEELQAQTLKTLAGAPFNKLRMCIFPKSYAYNTNEPDRFPFVRNSDSSFNFSIFDPVFWRHLENQIIELGKLGIQADLILFHGYDRWGFSEMDDASDDRYIRYAIARLAAYHNVWWSLANEFDFMNAPPRQNHRGNKQMEDWDRFFSIIQKEDPYHRLRSIHNGKIWYDHTKEWVTHASIQSSDLAKGIELRNKYNKPVIFDECRYEGNITQGWGRLSGKEMVQRFWLGVVSGCYVGHGETFMHPEDIIWWSKGGVLYGESPMRIAFLRKIMESLPFKEMIPVRQSDNVFLLTKPGQVYLAYSTQAGPVNLKLEGEKNYNVEVIDTWNMTIKTLESAKSGDFTFNAPEEGFLLRFTAN
jgi:hypothetical protein